MIFLKTAFTFILAFLADSSFSLNLNTEKTIHYNYEPVTHIPGSSETVFFMRH